MERNAANKKKFKIIIGAITDLLLLFLLIAFSGSDEKRQLKQPLPSHQQPALPLQPPCLSQSRQTLSTM